MAKPLGAQQKVSLQRCPHHDTRLSHLHFADCFQLYFATRFSFFMQLQEHLPSLLPGSSALVFGGHTSRLSGSQFPDQGLNLFNCTWQLKAQSPKNWTIREVPDSLLTFSSCAEDRINLPPKWSSFSSLLVSANMSPPERNLLWDFPGDPVAKTPCFQRGAPGSIHGWGTRAHMLQLRLPKLQLRVHMLQLKIPCATTKSQSSQINIGEKKNNPLTTLPTATATAKPLQSCPTLCDPRDSSPPGSPVSGILQARTLEWVAISFSNA